MTISQTSASDDDFKAALARAFDAAWEPFIALEGEAADTGDNRRRLASKIVQLARFGETDEDVLGEAGLIHLRVLAAAARIGAHHRDHLVDDSGAPGIVPPQWDHGHAYGPEAVAAMSAALDRCLDTLPFHLPSDAVTHLSSSILAEASRGERDPDRLQVHALEALKGRQ